MVKLKLDFCAFILLIMLCYCEAVKWSVYEKTDTFKEHGTMMGYPVEAYSLQTKDEYVLRVHRIPANNTSSKKVVFLMHGMFCSSIDWILIGKGKSLALLLHDMGYDVWLGNARGNTFSRNHLRISPNSRKFWEFSWHEIGLYDVPTMINFALSQSNATQLDYFGHSQGVTTFMVMTSLIPSMNSKIRTMIGLSPITYVSNLASKILRLMATNIDTVERFCLTLQIYELLPSKELYAIIGRFFCSDVSITQELCANLLFLAIGPDPIHLNKTLLPSIFTNIPAGISYRQFLHYGQVINSAIFRPYDFKNRNLQIYKQTKPPPYPLENITGNKFHFYYGTTDVVMSKKDVEILSNHLLENDRNTVTIDEIPNYNHLDYLFAVNVTETLYNKLFTQLNEN